MSSWLVRSFTIVFVIIGLRLAASHMPDKSTVSSSSEKTSVTTTTHTSEGTNSEATTVTSNDEILKSESTQTNELIARLQQASAKELLAISDVVVNPEYSNETRQKSVYALAHLGAPAIPALTAIATTPMTEGRTSDPHSAKTYRFKEELGLRISAIEALDRLSAENPEIKSSMQLVLKNQTDRTLTLLAQISLSGIESGHPGKVQRAVETLLKENN